MYHTLMLLEAAQLPASGGRMKLTSRKTPCTNTGTCMHATYMMYTRWRENNVHEAAVSNSVHV